MRTNTLGEISLDYLDSLLDAPTYGSLVAGSAEVSSGEVSDAEVLDEQPSEEVADVGLDAEEFDPFKTDDAPCTEPPVTLTLRDGSTISYFPWIDPRPARTKLSKGTPNDAIAAHEQALKKCNTLCPYLRICRDGVAKGFTRVGNYYLRGGLNHSEQKALRKAFLSSQKQEASDPTEEKTN